MIFVGDQIVVLGRTNRIARVRRFGRCCGGAPGVSGTKVLIDDYGWRGRRPGRLSAQGWSVIERRIGRRVKSRIPVTVPVWLISCVEGVGNVVNRADVATEGCRRSVSLVDGRGRSDSSQGPAHADGCEAPAESSAGVDTYRGSGASDGSGGIRNHRMRRGRAALGQGSGGNQNRKSYR